MDSTAKTSRNPWLTLATVLVAGIAIGCSQGTAPPPGSSAANGPKPAPAENTSTDAHADHQRIPAYFESVEDARPLPTPRPASRYKEFPVIERAYTVAAEIPEVLAQQPCYCYCDRSSGHGSLADCWASDHGAG